MERGRNKTLRLHNEHGPAMKFADGLAVYAIHGVRVLEVVVEKPKSITFKMISDEANAEVRRVMIDRFGRERWLKDSGAQKIHRDEFGTLYQLGREMAVEVINSTPEPDGTRKKYLLWVDPNGYGGIQTAHAAVAWTWRNPDGSQMFEHPEDYGPAFES